MFICCYLEHYTLTIHLFVLLGGWLLVTNYTVTDGVYIPVSSQLTEDIHDVASSNFTKYLSSYTGFGVNLRTFMTMSQIRFYCTTDSPGRTIHVKFLPVPEIHSGVFNFFTSSSANTVTFPYVELYQDDTSVLSRDKTRWGKKYATNHLGQLSPQNFQGVFGNVYTAYYALYQDPLFISGSVAWWVGYSNLMKCDTNGNDVNMKYGTWKIYVR